MAEVAVVGKLDSVGLVLHLHNRDNRAERLFLHDRHRMVDVHQNRGGGDDPPGCQSCPDWVRTSSTMSPIAKFTSARWVPHPGPTRPPRSG